MNDKRRTNLKRAINMLESASAIIEAVCDEEQDCMDNYPENLQGTDKYEQMESAVDSMSDAVDKISDAVSCVESAIR